MSKKGMLKMIDVPEQPKPEVFRAICCASALGITIKVNGQWRLYVTSTNKDRQIVSTSHKVGFCRGCNRILDDSIPLVEWKWELDPQLDEHIMQDAARQAIA